MAGKEFVDKSRLKTKYFCELSQEEISQIIDIHFEHWVRFNPALDRSKVENEFRTEYSVSRDKIPLGIAVFESENATKMPTEKSTGQVQNKNCGQLLAFCRLRVTNLKCCPKLTPWISGLYVLPEFRNQGIGKLIVDKICAIAKSLGTKTMYVWTDQTPDFYVKLGFDFVRKVEKNEGGEALLFSKKL